MDCSICYEAINVASGSVQMAGCSHSFHFRCIATWFQRQESERAGQTCPCCRQEPSDLGRLPPVPEEDEEETLIYEDAEETLEPLQLPAPIHWPTVHAQDRYEAFRHFLSEEELQSYAATRIGALVRGYLVRADYWRAKVYLPKVIESTNNCLIDSLHALNTDRRMLRKTKREHAMALKRLTMGRTAWRHYTAISLQRWWRAVTAKRDAALVAAYNKQDYALALKNKKRKLTISWRRLDYHIWQRIVPNPEERDPETFNMAYDNLPPQSLAFEMDYGITKIQSAWRGRLSRRRVAAMRSQ
jgi:hypothetical protein